MKDNKQIIESLNRHISINESERGWRFNSDADVNEIDAFIEICPALSISIYFGHDATSKIEDFDRKPWYVTVNCRNREIEDNLIFRNLQQQYSIPSDFVNKLRNRWKEICNNYDN